MEILAMPVVQRGTWKVRPGKTQEFLANVLTAKKILERLGARVRVMNQLVGANAPCTLVIIESPDWKAFGERLEKMQSDSEWQSFFATAVLNNANPAADLIDTALSADLPLG
jgi:hypothetical protein